MKSTLVEKAGASDASGIASACLQQILGTDKRNPIFSLFEDPVHQSVHLYYGAELFEVVPKNKGHLAFKCLLGRLYNAGLKAKSLQQVFKVDRKTMQRWGQALQGDDPELLIRALAGRGAHRKLTVEIRSFVALRFAVLYAQSRRGYSQEIRAEIKQVFGVSLRARHCVLSSANSKPNCGSKQPRRRRPRPPKNGRLLANCRPPSQARAQLPPPRPSAPVRKHPRLWRQLASSGPFCPRPKVSVCAIIWASWFSAPGWGAWSSTSLLKSSSGSNGRRACSWGRSTSNKASCWILRISIDSSGRRPVRCPPNARS